MGDDFPTQTTEGGETPRRLRLSLKPAKRSWHTIPLHQYGLRTNPDIPHGVKVVVRLYVVLVAKGQRNQSIYSAKRVVLDSSQPRNVRQNWTNNLSMLSPRKKRLPKKRRRRLGRYLRRMPLAHRLLLTILKRQPSLIDEIQAPQK